MRPATGMELSFRVLLDGCLTVEEQFAAGAGQEETRATEDEAAAAAGWAGFPALPANPAAALEPERAALPLEEEGGAARCGETQPPAGMEEGFSSEPAGRGAVEPRVPAQTISRPSPFATPAGARKAEIRPVAPPAAADVASAAVAGDAPAGPFGIPPAGAEAPAETAAPQAVRQPRPQSGTPMPERETAAAMAPALPPDVKPDAGVHRTAAAAPLQADSNAPVPAEGPRPEAPVPDDSEIAEPLQAAPAPVPSHAAAAPEIAPPPAPFVRPEGAPRKDGQKSTPHAVSAPPSQGEPPAAPTAAARQPVSGASFEVPESMAGAVVKDGASPAEPAFHARLEERGEAPAPRPETPARSLPAKPGMAPVSHTPAPGREISERIAAVETQVRAPGHPDAGVTTPAMQEAPQPAPSHSGYAVAAPPAESGAPARPQPAASSAPAAAPPETPEPPPSPRTPVRDVSVRLAGDDRSVEIRMAERAGEIRVSVHAADGELRNALQDGLPELVQGLEQRGFNAQAWRAGENGTHGEEPFDQPSSGGQQQGAPQDGRERRRHSEAAWLDELHRGLEPDPERNDADEQRQ